MPWRGAQSMKASRVREPVEPSRVLWGNEPRPRSRKACPPGWVDGGGGDGASADADAWCPTEQYADGRSRVAWPPRIDSREAERSGSAFRRKSKRAVSSTRRGCSSSDNQIGGLQKLVLRAFCRELATVEKTAGLRRHSWAEPSEALTCWMVRARQTRYGHIVDTRRRVDDVSLTNSTGDVRARHGGRCFRTGCRTP